MRKIILTVGLKSSAVKDNNPGVGVDIGDIIDMYPEVLKNPIKYKPVAILKYLNNSKGDLIIGNAIDKISDYIELDSGLSDKANIVKVIVKFPNFSMWEYEKQYKVHGRWLDYSPEAARDIAEDYVKHIHLLVERLIHDGIDVEIMDT
jgi:hypothetical protein